MALLILLLALFSPTIAEDRNVAVTGRLGCISEAGAWIPMPEAVVTLWEEDYGFWESHDEIAKTSVDANGTFKLSGSHSESGAVRFFISTQVLCNGVRVGAWRGGPCADEELKARCAPQEISGGKYARFGDAWFTHLFEYNPDGEENVKANYNLDCVFGFRNEKGTMKGLTCDGSLCNGGRCGHERSMGALTITAPDRG